LAVFVVLIQFLLHLVAKSGSYPGGRADVVAAVSSTVAGGEG